MNEETGQIVYLVVVACKMTHHWFSEPYCTVDLRFPTGLLTEAQLKTYYDSDMDASQSRRPVLKVVTVKEWTRVYRLETWEGGHLHYSYEIHCVLPRQLLQ